MRRIILCLSFALIFLCGNAQNSGLVFNGIDENLVLCNNPDLNLQQNLTVEGWIYANAWKSQHWAGTIVGKDGTDGSGYALRAGNNGQLSFVIAVQGQWLEALSGLVMNQDQWHHVAATINNGLITLYIDGVPSGTKTFTSPMLTNDNSVFIGESTGFPGRQWNGIMDEIRIWNVTRSQQEIVDNAAVSLIGDEPGLVLYLPMNEGTGTITGNLAEPNCRGRFFNMDESNWSDGFVIPEFDISMNPVTGIDIVNMKNRPVKTFVTLKNSGTTDVTNVEVVINIDGANVVTEEITATIPAGEEFKYNFQTPIDLTTSNNPTITFTANHPDDQNLVNNSKSINIPTVGGNFVRIFDSEGHNFGSRGQSQFKNALFPSDLSNYESILMHINVDCPSGGCDPWDQPANVSIDTDKGNFEIARYITPFGIACGDWIVDVTDFKEMLAGPVSFQSFIQVWGQSGWLVTIDLELIEGNNGFNYYKTTPLWGRNNVVYGDPNISYDLDAVMLTIDNNTENSHIRTTISGHGQGNTDNAAEFSRRTHQFQLNGVAIDDHFLWKSDCAANPCSGQLGTWLFARSGWCPGQAVEPYIVPTPNVNGGDNIEIDYELENYTNLLNTGYNSSGHTEPHYRIWSYFVERSSQRYQDYQNLVSDMTTPTISGTGTDQTLDAVEIQVTNNGSTNLSNFEISYMVNNTLITNQTINETLAPNETKTYSFTMVDGLNAGFQNTFFGIVSHPNDENLGDDVSKSFIDGMVSSTEVIEATASIEVFPNPVQNGIFQIKAAAILEGSRVDLVSVDGKIIQTETLRSTNLEMRIFENGIYFLRFTHPDGYISNKKLVVTQ